MTSIRVKPINSEFIIVWMKLNMRNGHTIDEFNLQPSGNHFTITNPVHLQSLKTDFANYRHSNLGMSEYFQCNIVIAKQEASEKFHIKKNVKLSYEKVILSIFILN